jgi:hypothetical protein
MQPSSLIPTTCDIVDIVEYYHHMEYSAPINLSAQKFNIFKSKVKLKGNDPYLTTDIKIIQLFFFQTIQ